MTWALARDPKGTATILFRKGFCVPLGPSSASAEFMPSVSRLKLKVADDDSGLTCTASCGPRAFFFAAFVRLTAGLACGAGLPRVGSGCGAG